MSNNFLEIPNVFTEKWCKTIIKYIDEKLGKDINTIENLDRIRETNTVMTSYISKVLSKHSKSIKDFIKNDEYYLHYQWFLTRYSNNGQLKKHVDGNTYDDKNKSCATILIYLNDDFDGGETVFYEEKKSIITPKTGSVLILNQDVLHRGRKITNGYKYILRGDIMKTI